MLVSVLMPAFNVEEYISQAIECVLSQTYKDFELIIIDDGSSDNTLKLAQKYAQKDSRVKVLFNDQNRNIVYSLNKAFNESVGSYILRMDADDLCDNNRLMKLVSFLKNNVKVDLVGTSLVSIDIENNVLGRSTYFSDETFLKSNIHLTTPVSHIWLARRQLYIDLNGYRNIPGAEDYDFLLRMLTNNKHFTNIEDDFSYRVRIGRNGNTASLIGVRQLKLKKYVYGLYNERLVGGSDSFSLSLLEKAVYTSPLLARVHNSSNYFLLNGIKFWSKKQYLLTLLNLTLSLVSPYQWSYLYGRAILKAKIRLKR
jgi:glycosyltransferase involved in cell wall biosynthesis